MHCQVCLSGIGEEKNITTGCMLRVHLENLLNIQLLVTVSSLAICSPCCNLIEMWSVFAARARKNLAAVSQNSSDLAGHAGGARLKFLQSQDLSRLLKQTLQSTDDPQTCLNTAAESSRDNVRNGNVPALVHPNLKACSVVLNRLKVEKILEQQQSASSRHETAGDLLQENLTTCHVALEKTTISEWNSEESYCPLEMKIEIGSDPPSPDNTSFGACSAPTSPVAASFGLSSDDEEPDDTSQDWFDQEVTSAPSSLLDTSSGHAKASVSCNVQENGRKGARKYNTEQRNAQTSSKKTLQNRFSLRNASKSIDEFAMCDSSNASGLNSQTLTDYKNNVSSSSLPQDSDDENEYTCTVCKSTFCHSYSLHRHYKSILHKNNVKASKVGGRQNKALDTSLDSFHCEMCNADFNKKSALMMHIKRHLKHNGIVLKSCDFCSKKFFTRKGLTEHIFTHLSEGKSFCHSCKTIFSNDIDLENHVTTLICKNLETWQCNYCTKQLSSRRYYREHLTNIHNINLIVTRKSEKDQGLKCKICEKVFSQKNHVTRHLIGVHKLIEPKNAPTRPPRKGAFKCNICNNRFSQKRNLSRHILRSHRMDPEKVLGNKYKNKRSVSTSRKYHKKTKCKICTRTYADKSSFKRHMERVCSKKQTRGLKVSQKLKLACKECKLVCRNMYRLRLHMLKVHNVDVPKFNCNKCDSSFLHRRNLEKHLKVSHATGDFMCEMCGTLFSDFFELENHIKHHQSAHFACQVCSESFENKTSLKDHVFWVHVFPTLPHTAWEFWNPEVFLLECDFCNETFTSEVQLENHTLEHLKQSKISTKNCNESVDNSIDAEMCALLGTDGPFRKMFPCFACNEEFTAFTALRQHILVVHKDAQQMQCKLCDSLTSDVNRYITHLQNCHKLNSGLKLQCPYCSNILKSQGKFVEHFGGPLPPGLNVADCCVSSETKKNTKPPYSCEFCENVYGSYTGHHKHVKDYHPEEWKHKCKFCDKKFLVLCKVLKHERYFHKDKYMCPYCEKTFAKGGQLKQHVQKVHDGKPVFFCPKCDIQFPSRLGLQNHTSKHDSFDFTTHKAQITNESTATNQILLGDINSLPRSSQGNSVICPNCNLHFPNLNQMKIHMYTLHKKIHCYSCKECGTVFSLLTGLEEHVQNYHTQGVLNQSQSKSKSKIGAKPVKANSKIYECKKCGEQTMSYSGYLSHAANCNPDAACKGCGKSRRYFRNNTLMSLHEEHCKTVRPQFKCPKCPLRFVYEHLLQKHQWRHDLCWADRMSCSHCPLSFDSIGKVLQHYTRQHMNQLPFPLFCKFCDFNCDNKVELKLHATQHNQQMVHCNQCHRDVSVARFQRCHILTCKSSICSMCSMECGSTANLFLHVQQDHKTAGEKHSCLLCLNSFPSESNLQQHVIHNHGQASFKCDICKVNISYKENLRSHINLHIHSKTRCRICGREFTAAAHNLQHVLKEHKDVIPSYFLETLCH